MRRIRVAAAPFHPLDFSAECSKLSIRLFYNLTMRQQGVLESEHLGLGRDHSLEESHLGRLVGHRVRLPCMEAAAIGDHGWRAC